MTVQPFRVESAYGRLYISGPGKAVAEHCSGAALNIKRQAYEVSLTLETLRTLRQKTGLDFDTFARYCAPNVVQWARATAASDKIVAAVHARLAAGERQPLPWRDARADTPAPPEASDKHVYVDEAGVRRYKYRAPYDHQQVMASAAAWLDGAGFVADVGTGKTRAAIEAAAHHLRTGALDVVIVVGKKTTMESVWGKESQVWADNLEPLSFVGKPPAKRKAQWATVRDFSRAAQRKSLLLLGHDQLRIDEAQFLATCKHLRVGLIVDESQKLRNPDAAVTQAATRVALQAKWSLILTGTPVITGEQDVWSQWYLIDKGGAFGPNFVSFRREWLDENPFTFKVTVKSPEAQREIGLRLRRRGVRVEKSVGLPGLPPQVWTEVPVEMTKEQWRAYEELRDDLVTHLGGEDGALVTATNQLTMMLRLAQITSGFVTDADGNLHRFEPNPKLQAVEELVEENHRNGPIILWAWYRPDVELLARHFKAFAPAVVYGGQSDKVRERDILRFQDGSTRLFIGNQGSAGAGLNLQMAPLAAYYSQDCNSEFRWQSEGRNHRGGSEIHSSITYVDFLATGTIDHTVLGILRGKKTVADAVVDLRRALGLTA